MSYDLIKRDIRRDEGLRLKPYKDSVGKISIGYGRNLDDIGITEEEAEILLAHDLYNAMQGLDHALPWWRNLDALKQRGLWNMAFNLGVPRLLKFKKMLAALQRGDWSAAADEALDSRWATQVGDRAKRIAELFRAEPGKET